MGELFENNNSFDKTGWLGAAALLHHWLLAGLAAGTWRIAQRIGVARRQDLASSDLRA